MFSKIVHVNLRRPAAWFFSALILLSGILLLIFSEPSADAISDALSLCGNILIPALFPFMVFSVFVVKSGLSEKLSRRLAPAMRALFKLPGSAAAVILTGWLGGYPAAARGIQALIEADQISPKQAERMTSFCICAGPSFVLSAVGVRMLGSLDIGLMLYAAQFAAALLMGWIGARFVKTETMLPTHQLKKNKPSLTGALISSVEDGVYSMLMVCGLVSLCAVLETMLKQIGLTDLFVGFLNHLGLSTISEAIPPILIEVTDGCRTAVQSGGFPVLMCALSLAWGGFCVHLQIFSSLHRIKLRIGRFYLLRLVQTLLSVLLTALFMRFFPQPATTAFSTLSRTPEPVAGQNGIWACLALVMMAVVFLFSTSTKSVFLSRKKWYDIREDKKERKEMYEK